MDQVLDDLTEACGQPPVNKKSRRPIDWAAVGLEFLE